jgi:hypothetical protein
MDQNNDLAVLIIGVAVLGIIGYATYCMLVLSR